MKENNKAAKQRLLLILAALCVFALAVAEGLESCADLSFNPINGDFQHYNMFRRLLDGQLPFRDFFVMIGLGVLYLNALVLAVLGNTFANSVFSTHFLLVLNGACIVFTLVYLFWRNKTAAAFTAVGFSLYVTGKEMITRMLLAAFPFLGAPWLALEKLLPSVSRLFVPDNASRPLRQLVLYAAAGGVLWMAGRKSRGGTGWFFDRGDLARSALYGAAAGLCFLWANDYGPAAYVGLSFLLFLWFAKGWLAGRCSLKKLLLCCLVHIAGSVLAVVLAVLLLTGGNFGAWFSASFSTAGEVYWYNSMVVTGEKLLTLFEIPPFDGQGVLPLLFAAGALCVSLVRWFTGKKRDFFAPCHILITSGMLFAFYFLILKRGYEDEYLNAFRQYALFGAVWLVSRALRAALSRLESEVWRGRLARLWRAGSAALCALLLAAGFVYSVNAYAWFPAAAAPNASYVAGLHGNVVTLSEPVLTASAAMEGKTLFSTYATAVETVNGTFQPSRYDYIIFTFGDAARAEYVDALHGSDPDYVAIINRDYTRWEGPVMGVKWFFYRELLQNYSYAFTCTYARYLERTGVSALVDCGFSLAVNRLDAGAVELVVMADRTDLDLVADLRIAYRSAFTSARFSALAVNRVVTVTGDARFFFPEGLFECWLLPEQHDAWYLPILIEDGVGRVVIRTLPESCTELAFTSAEVLGLYDFEKAFGPNNF